MMTREKLLEVVEPIAPKMPGYHPDALDINAALDDGVASCAVRAYAAGLLLRRKFPNANLYRIDFGFASDHGTDFDGENGTYSKMGHAVVRFWFPEREPVIVESFTDAMLEVTAQSEVHQGFNWMGLDEGYRAYLDIVGLDEVEVDSEEILTILNRE